MNVLGVVLHEFEGRKYEIVRLWNDAGWQVIIHDEKKRKVGPTFSMSLEDAQDYQAYKQQPALDALVDLAKSEIDSGRVKSKTSTDGA
jgi:hypothetical protein